MDNNSLNDHKYIIALFAIVVVAYIAIKICKSMGSSSSNLEHLDLGVTAIPVIDQTGTTTSVTETNAKDLQKYAVLNFEHMLPIERYPDLIREFGNPEFLTNQAGGSAIWRPNQQRLFGGSIYNTIMLKDEEIMSCFPIKHYEFLYASVNMNIPEEMLCTVLSISKSIMYDKLKRVLTVRSNYMGGNRATIWTAFKIVNGGFSEKTVAELQDLYARVSLATINADGTFNMEFQNKLDTEIAQLMTIVNGQYAQATAETEPCSYRM